VELTGNQFQRIQLVWTNMKVNLVVTVLDFFNL